jgi:CheY-like chemotaxis protein
MANILVVDDSAFARSNLRRTLTGGGHQVWEADSGEKALEIVASNIPDVITLDLLMPGMNGQETLKELRPLCPRAAIIVITADIQTITRQEILSGGANVFLNKPVNGADLLRTIQELLAPPSA